MIYTKDDLNQAIITWRNRHYISTEDWEKRWDKNIPKYNSFLKSIYEKVKQYEKEEIKHFYDKSKYACLSDTEKVFLILMFYYEICEISNKFDFLHNDNRNNDRDIEKNHKLFDKYYDRYYRCESYSYDILDEAIDIWYDGNGRVYSSYIIDIIKRYKEMKSILDEFYNDPDR